MVKAQDKFWVGEPGTADKFGQRDDFGFLIGNEFIDGKTIYGPWGIMAGGQSFATHGVGLGTGKGQRYAKQPDGRWKKVEG